MGSSRRKHDVIEEGREYRPSTSRPVGEEESRGGVGGLVLVSYYFAMGARALWKASQD
jgi:hypothetical protein